jgi:hypothetical protein
MNCDDCVGGSLCLSARFDFLPEVSIRLVQTLVDWIALCRPIKVVERYGASVVAVKRVENFVNVSRREIQEFLQNSIKWLALESTRLAVELFVD